MNIFENGTLLISSGTSPRFLTCRNPSTSSILSTSEEIKGYPFQFSSRGNLYAAVHDKCVGIRESKQNTIIQSFPCTIADSEKLSIGDTTSGLINQTCEWPKGLTFAYIAFSQDQTKVLITSGSTRIQKSKLYMIDLISGRLLENVVEMTYDVGPLAVLPHDQLFVYADKQITIFYIEIVPSIDMRNTQFKITQQFNAHSLAITALQIAENGKIIITGSEDASVKIWKRLSGKLLQTIAHPFRISSVYSKDLATLYVGDHAGGVWAWKLNWQNQSVAPQLLWTTRPSFMCTDVDTQYAIGLSESDRCLMVQHGAIEQNRIKPHGNFTTLSLNFC